MKGGAITNLASPERPLKRPFPPHTVFLGSHINFFFLLFEMKKILSSHISKGRDQKAVFFLFFLGGGFDPPASVRYYNNTYKNVPSKGLGGGGSEIMYPVKSTFWALPYNVYQTL